MIGQTFSHYRILEQLGESDFPGPLYKAEELESRALVALRVLGSSFGLEERKRLVRIAAAASQLAHPNVESLTDVGETDDGELFYCGEFRAGDTLDRWIEHRELAASDAFDIVGKIARGLSRAHHAGIVHGALRPEMVKLLDGHRVEVVGFGFAVLAGEGLSVRSGDPVAALSYRSPEQIRGGRPHPRIDVWALGIMLYEMLTGRRPFEGTTAGSLAESVLGDEPPPVSGAWKAAPPELDRVMARALSKEIDQRYQGVAELVRDLAPLAPRLGKPERPQALPPPVAEVPATPSAAKAARRQKKVVASASRKPPAKKVSAGKATSKKSASKQSAKKNPPKARTSGVAPPAADPPALSTEPPSARADETSAPPISPERARMQWTLFGGGLLLLLAILAWLLGGF